MNVIHCRDEKILSITTKGNKFLGLRKSHHNSDVREIIIILAKATKGQSNKKENYIMPYEEGKRKISLDRYSIRSM